MSDMESKCDLCGKPLLGGGGWIDNEDYGDVHESCLEKIELGYDPMDDDED